MQLTRDGAQHFRCDPSREPARRRVLQLNYSADELPGGLEWLGV